MKILFDTDIVIHLLKQQPLIVNELLQLRQKANVQLHMCPIVIAEIYAGAFKHEWATIEAFFSLCQFITIDSETGRIAGNYANQYCKAYNRISLEDYLIAACAKQYKLTLWTNNKKHYPMDDINLYQARDE